MRYPYHLYDAYINIDDISINKIDNHDLPPTRVQAMIENAICKGIRQGLAAIGINEEILPTSVNVSVWEHLDGWIRCDEQLPPYGQSVLVCLEDGTRCMTCRSERDYSRDKYNFLHVTICKDAEYWMELPDTPRNIKEEHRLKPYQNPCDIAIDAPSASTNIDNNAILRLPNGTRILNILLDRHWPTKSKNITTIEELKNITFVEYREHRNAGERSWNSLKEYIQSLDKQS